MEGILKENFEPMVNEICGDFQKHFLEEFREVNLEESQKKPSKTLWKEFPEKVPEGMMDEVPGEIMIEILEIITVAFSEKKGPGKSSRGNPRKISCRIPQGTTGKIRNS